MPRARKRTTSAKRADAPLQLFWCTTADHDEDWFVVAPSELAACRQHEDAEGYERGDADAAFVCALPATLARPPTGWPSDGVLLACGAEFIDRRGVRVVRIGDRVFGEGDVATNAAVRTGVIKRQ